MVPFASFWVTLSFQPNFPKTAKNYCAPVHFFLL
jgi:hypothetical protein